MNSQRAYASLARLMTVCAVCLLSTSCSTSRVPSERVVVHSADSAVIRYDTIHHPTYASEGMVVTQNTLATTIGQQVLATGGNAVDAAVATGFALAVTLPRAGNLGGSGFMLVYLADEQRTIALDYRSQAPAAMSPELIRDEQGSLDFERIRFGPLAPAVPGTVAGLREAWERYGSLPWGDLLAPAIALAKEGFLVTDDLAYVLDQAAKTMRRYPSSASIFLQPNGQALAVGDRLIQRDLAWSLERIQAGGADAFYRGELAKRLVQGLRRDGGVITLEDLASYRVKERQPIVGTYRDHTVVSMPPVSGGGVTLIQMLNVLEHFDLGSLPQGSAQSLHLLAETMKRSAANRRVSLGDPDYSDVPVTGFTSKALATQLARQISPTRATPTREIKPSDARQFESRETTHYSVVDRHGNAVANTYTLGYSFGSAYVAPDTGILLDNQVRNFTYSKPGHANAIAPGKRMLSTMTPTLVFDRDQSLKLVTGTPGGGRIINVVLQVLVNVIDYDMNIAEATHAPRIHQQWRTQALGVEQGVGVDTIRLLEQMGHVVEVQPAMGSVQSVMRRDGLLEGSADPRRPGALALGVR